MSSHHIRHPAGFRPGYTPITRIDETDADTGIAFGILRLSEGERRIASPGREGAWLLMQGQVRFHFDGLSVDCGRESLFDDDPVALHWPAGADVQVEALGPCELAVCGVRNPADFPVVLFDGDTMLQSDHRGKGQLGDTAYRIVRTLFDIRNRPQALLVLGEVVNFPGRWSSYPPHHHPQPEIYHYRFSAPQGYGHGELGEQVLKLRQYDTVKILHEVDHAQVSAPGYAMYYIWIIRHLPDLPYTVPEFTAEHRWLLDPAPPVWSPLH